MMKSITKRFSGVGVSLVLVACGLDDKIATAPLTNYQEDAQIVVGSLDREATLTATTSCGPRTDGKAKTICTTKDLVRPGKTLCLDPQRTTGGVVLRTTGSTGATGKTKLVFFPGECAGAVFSVDYAVDRFITTDEGFPMKPAGCYQLCVRNTGTVDSNPTKLWLSVND